LRLIHFDYFVARCDRYWNVSQNADFYRQPGFLNDSSNRRDWLSWIIDWSLLVDTKPTSGRLILREFVQNVRQQN
jgi:hypothetical protein